MGARLGVEVRANLRRSWLDGVCYMLMVGLGEYYLPAFVLAVGLGQVFSGWVATLPMLAGALLQMVTPEGVRRCGSMRRWVVASAAIQGAVFLPLAWIAATGRASAWVVFALATAYWASGLATGPAWMTWITTIVPASLRARYFALRNRALWLALLLCFVFGGWLLRLAQLRGRELEAFAALFVLAGLARFASARFLAEQDEPLPLPRDYRVVPRRELIGRLKGTRDGRLVRYMFSVQIAAQVAQPFFTAYILEQLGVTYTTYALLIAAQFAARVAALPWLGAFARKHGAARTIWLGGLLLVPLPLPWILTDSLPVLFVAQLASGVAWAAYELGTFLQFFETSPERERTSLFALYNVGNAGSMAAGSAIGGLLLGALGATRQAFLWVFLLSTVLRVLTVLFLRRLEPAAETPGTSLASASRKG